MKIYNLIQGGVEWLAYRAKHFNASDAPAMMGVSPYKSRAQLLREIHSGMTAEIDAGKQRLFDDGHRAEALARPLAEEIIGDSLYPVTGSDGQYSASFDGLTLEFSKNFEHKALNELLREAIPENGCNGNERLPLVYRVQIEQQMMVSGATQTLFMASKWDSEGNLIEARHCWCTPDPELRAKIIVGWAQFAADLAAYEAPEADAPKPVGKAPESLPALRIEVTGQVTATNLADFKATALGAIQSVNRDLQTDQDFADAEKSVKWCADVEDRLKAAKEHALSQTASIDALFKTMDDIGAEARRVRLDLEKLVKARKESLRVEIVTEASTALGKHFAALNARLGHSYMPSLIGFADFGGVIKGKKNFDSMRDAMSTELARAKIAANEIADKIQTNMQALVAVGDKVSFPDAATLVHKAPDDLAAIIAQRVADAERRAQEAIEKAKAEEAAKAAALAEPIPVPATVAAPAPAPVAAAPSIPARTTQVSVPAATIKLGDINAHIAPLSITAEGMRTIGFEPVGRDKSAVLYRAGDLGRICQAMARHLQAKAQAEAVAA